MNKENYIPRRTVIKGLGAGLASMAILPGFAAGEKSTTNALKNLEDPITHISFACQMATLMVMDSLLQLLNVCLNFTQAQLDPLLLLMTQQPTPAGATL